MAVSAFGSVIVSTPRSQVALISIDANKINATCDLGVLTITLPKAETAKPHVINVEVTPAKALLND